MRKNIHLDVASNTCFSNGTAGGAEGEGEGEDSGPSVINCGTARGLSKAKPQRDRKKLLEEPALLPTLRILILCHIKRLAGIRVLPGIKHHR